MPEVDCWWRKCRIGAHGSEGFAEVLTGGGWRDEPSGGGSMNYDLDMPPYIQEMADWLNDAGRAHQCAFDSAYQAFEIMMAICRSVAEGGQVALPLVEGADEIALLRKHLPDNKVLLSMPENAKEYAAAR